MTALRQRLLEDLQLRGYSAGTQQLYVRAVRQLAEYVGKAPDHITEEELRQYFLYLTQEKRLSRSSCTVALCGIKFFYEYTLQRRWPTLELVRPAKAHKLPVVLSGKEVRQVLAQVRKPAYRVCLSTIYACGLRISEGRHLQVADIDSARMMIHVRGGKNAKDRYVPLPQPTLVMLRQYWVTHRHPVWLFPILPLPADVAPHLAPGPMAEPGMRFAFGAAVQASGLHKHATIHTLRHSWRVPFGCHLLEAGVNLRLIQIWLGHTSLKTTALYTHLTHKAEVRAVEASNQLMADLVWSS
jgi:site-specific recombinase XerD